MLEMKFNKIEINEGAFKDIDKEIISIDDPDYEQKVKDQTFNDFQESDAKKKADVVYEWLEKHLWIYHAPYYIGFATKDKEHQYFELRFINTDFPVIDILNPSTKTFSNDKFAGLLCYIESEDGSSPTNANGELPYKFGLCEGSFTISQHSAAHTYKYQSITLKSFKNIPTVIEGGLTIAGWKLQTGLGENNPFTFSENFATLPQGLTIRDTFSIEECYGLTNFSGMPDNIQLKNGLRISHCPDLTDCTGWNPSAKFGSEVRIFSKQFTIKDCENFCSFKGLPDNFSCYDMEVIGCGLKGLDTLPKNLNVQHELNLRENYLGGSTLVNRPMPPDITVGMLYIGIQKTPGSEFPRIDYKFPTKSKLHPIPIPQGVEAFSIWGGHNEKNNGNLKYYWRRMWPHGISPNHTPINEGLFTDLDKNIVDPDDPDYESKVKDQTFKDFQESDRALIEMNNIRKWVCQNLYIIDYANGGTSSDWLQPEDENKYFEITGTNVHNAVINLLSDTTRYYLAHRPGSDLKTEISLVNDKGELPYKFGYCRGHFAIGGEIRRGWQRLKSFKNVPTEVNGSFEITVGICHRAGQHPVKIPISTLPAGLTVGKQLYISADLTTLKGMPDNITAYELNFSKNSNLANLEGFNPTTKCQQLIISGCKNFKSLKGLPDGFSCKDIMLYSNNITEISDWPKNLTITDNLELGYNKLTMESLCEHPFPASLRCVTLDVGQQYNPDLKTANKPKWIQRSKKFPIPIPMGIGIIKIWSNEHVPNIPFYDGCWKWISEEQSADTADKINEGLFKDLDKNIINVDDPEYEQKVKDQTFKEFQRADRKNKKIAEVQNWLAEYVSVCDWTNKDLKYGPRLVQKFYGELYRINFRNDDTEFEDPEIELGPDPNIEGENGDSYIFISFDIRMGINASRTGKPSPFVHGKLPYKFGKCYGSFYMKSEALANIDKFISAENIPYWISGECILNYGDLSDLSTLPKGLTVYKTLDLANNGLKSLNGMPDDIQCGTIDLSFNDLTDCTGWNPTAKVNDNFIITNCGYFKSLKGLPDDFSISGKMDLKYNHIESFEEWPQHLAVDGDIRLSGNYLDGAKFPTYPRTVFPEGWTCNGVIDCSYQADTVGGLVKNLKPEYIGKHNVYKSDYITTDKCRAVRGIPYLRTKSENDRIFT